MRVVTRVTWVNWVGRGGPRDHGEAGRGRQLARVGRRGEGRGGGPGPRGVTHGLIQQRVDGDFTRAAVASV